MSGHGGFRYEKYNELEHYWGCQRISLREADIRELQAVGHTEVPLAIRSSIEVSSRTWVILKDEKVVGVFGVRYADTTGFPWLLADPCISEVPFTFIKESRRIVDIMSASCTHLENYTWEEHTDSIRYLKLLGFTFNDEYRIIYTKDRSTPFIRFYKMREV